MNFRDKIKMISKMKQKNLILGIKYEKKNLKFGAKIEKNEFEFWRQK